MNFKSNVDGQVITVEALPNFKYGIFLSGGIDSAILLYCVAHDAQNKNIPISIQPFSIRETVGPVTRAVNDIIEYVNGKLHTRIPHTIEVGSTTTHHSKKSHNAFLEILNQYPHIDGVLQGTNQNPPPPFNYERYGTSGSNPLRVRASSHPKSLLPFISLHKSHVIDLMFQLQIEELANLTHSCTGLQMGRCNNCFQDHERAWAFDQLGKVDTGTM